MKHTIIIFTILLVFTSTRIPIKGQSVNYYKLTKIEDYGKVESRCTGGQFIKINKNVCFDSDVHGNSVGNGKLYRDVKNSSSHIIYIGNSFHGNSKYIFSQDYKSLIVEITPKFRYIYRLATPPTDVTTCTLIKSGNNGSPNPVANPYPIQNGYNNGYNVNQSGSSNSNANSNSSSNSNTNNSTQKFKCAYCNGTGMIEKNDNAPASFGQNRPRQQCPTCGKWYDPTVFTHYHQQCRHCGGTGYAK